MPPLTEQAHAILRHVVRAGDVVVDATAGNGHDTRFLAELVEGSGQVFAIDLQPEALRQTAALLGELPPALIHLVERDNAELSVILPVEFHGQIAAVMFNLGYLPGGDRTLATRTESTLKAIRAALTLLRPGGLLTVIAYPGHQGGDDEATAVADLLLGLSAADFQTNLHRAASLSPAAPLLFIVTKLGSN